jgi:hypothetical protein
MLRDVIRYYSLRYALGEICSCLGLRRLMGSDDYQPIWLIRLRIIAL